jgi:hypothetical protein
MLRLGASALVAVVLIAGTAFGDDDNFPFGPFRMYSTKNELNGTINSVRFHAIDENGRAFDPRSQDFGLRPAEINGRVGRFRADVELLGQLADAYRKAHPDAPDIAELTLSYGIWTLENGRPVSFEEESLVTWRAEG